MKNKIVKSSLLLGAVAVMSIGVAHGQAVDLTTVATKGTANIFSLMGLLFAGSSVIGFFLAIVGILYFKKDRQQPNQGHGATGMQYLGVGIALLAIVFIIKMVLTSFGGTGEDATKRLDDSGWKAGGTP